jgi:Flp pilus assembly protein TadD
MPVAHYELGLAVEREGDLARAEAEFRQAVALDPKDRKAHLALASLLRRRGDTQGAQSEFSVAKQLDQQEVNSDLARGADRAGVLLAEQKQWSAAIEQFQKALQLQPNIGEARFNLAGALLEAGRVLVRIERAA